MEVNETTINERSRTILAHRGGPSKTRAVLLAAAAFLATLTSATHGQVVLDGPNLAGSLGLTGQTFGSAYLSFYWPGGSVETQLVNGDSTFSVRVAPDQILSASASMYSWQGATNAYLYHSMWNIPGPTATATTPLQLNLSRPSGRIVGRVSVIGGGVTRIDMSASKSISTNEYFSGQASTSITPFDAILPFVAAPAVSVQGSAVLRASAGCDVPVALSAKSADVPADGTATVTWTFDLSGEQCLQGSLQGQVSFSGLQPSNSDVVPVQRFVQLSGPVNRYQQTDAEGRYVFAQVPPGSYYLYNSNSFSSPYSGFNTTSSNVQVAAGTLLTRDFAHEIGTAHGNIQATGAWTLNDTSYFYANANVLNGTTYVAGAWDYADKATGNIDFVLPVGNAQVSSFFAYFNRNDGVRFTSQSINNYYYTAPLQTAIAVGDRDNLGVLALETSESLVVVQPVNTAVGLTNLVLTGGELVRNAAGAYLESRSIYLSSSAIGTPQNSVAVLVRGLPGTYRMTATGQGTDGATYSKQFELVLGAPANTPTGENVATPIVLTDQTTGTTVTGSITFGSVGAAGETTVSASGSGPQAPGNFRVFGSGSMMYYDITTTAEFDTATVCLRYDDTGLSSRREEMLTLQHYECAGAGNTSCSWIDITAAGYPNTTTNEICGVTNSFSIFALMEPLDSDADGRLDDVDNCPATANPDQANADGDLFGDACDSDVDGDAIDDTADNCRFMANPDQANIDNDAFGDACDVDLDNDSVPNAEDNCALQANSTQADFDVDGLGDACDADDDSDGVADGADSCAGTSLGAAILGNGCSSAQQLALACPVTAVYRNHGEYVQCVAHAAEAQAAVGLIGRDEKDAIVATAAKSGIGKQ